MKKLLLLVVVLTPSILLGMEMKDRDSETYIPTYQDIKKGHVPLWQHIAFNTNFVKASGDIHDFDANDIFEAHYLLGDKTITTRIKFDKQHKFVNYSEQKEAGNKTKPKATPHYRVRRYVLLEFFQKHTLLACCLSVALLGASAFGIKKLVKHKPKPA